MNYPILLLGGIALLAGCQTKTSQDQFLPTTASNLTSPPIAASLLIPASANNPTDSLDVIKMLAENSQCAKIYWNPEPFWKFWKGDIGYAPKGYIKGIALEFAKSICNKNSPDVEVVAQANTNNDKLDALSLYDSEFAKLGMKNNASGLDTLRHVFVLLTGLGMPESSGNYCVGRDMRHGFNSSDSAEAGLFQASWGANVKNTELSKLFDKYKKASSQECLLDVFKEGTSCKESDAKNWGSPNDEGYKWQKLTKTCPAFATEYAAVLVRFSGGAKGEFGPLRDKSVEIRSECDDLLGQIQQVIQKQPSLCKLL